MRKQHPVADIGRQDGIKSAVTIAHQRSIVEAVGMIVHIASVEEESSILRLSYKPVPLMSPFSTISDDFKHWRN